MCWRQFKSSEWTPFSFVHNFWRFGGTWCLRNVERHFASRCGLTFQKTCIFCSSGTLDYVFISRFAGFASQIQILYFSILFSSSSTRESACEMPSCEMIWNEIYSFECSFLLNVCGNKGKYFRGKVYNICFCMTTIFCKPLTISAKGNKLYYSPLWESFFLA